jgi:drug/metabolite transporter (DMT)-like permease
VSAGALALVLTAAVVHAGWNALAKRARDPVVFLWSSVSAAAVLLLPLGVWVIREGGWTPGSAPFVIATSLLHGTYFYTLGRAYGSGDFSLVYPVARGLGVALVPLVALVVLDERLSPLGVAGVALVIAGVAGLHFRPRSRTPAVAATAPDVAPVESAGWLGAGTAWAVVTGLLIAAYSVLDKAGVARIHPVAYISLMGVGISLLLTPVALARREALRREWRVNWRTIAVAATMNLTSYLLVLFAFRISKAGYVVAARESSIVFSVLIGSVWMGEGRIGLRMAGAAVILGGVGCIALAR